MLLNMALSKVHFAITIEMKGCELKNEIYQKDDSGDEYIDIETPKGITKQFLIKGSVSTIVDDNRYILIIISITLMKEEYTCYIVNA
jgi:hypothetical protein